MASSSFLYRPAVWPGGLGRRRPILWLVVWTLAWQALGGVLQFYRSTVGYAVNFGFELTWFWVAGFLGKFAESFVPGAAEASPGGGR